MISRSDGRHFHLLLADHPLPYPAELGGGPTQTVCVCFWYAYGGEKTAAKSAVVLFEPCGVRQEKMDRLIKFIADGLADELLRRRELAAFYKLRGKSVLVLRY